MLPEDSFLFSIDLSEIDAELIVKVLKYEDLDLVPFDGSKSYDTALEAQDRVMWTLNNCVENLIEFKEAVSAGVEDPKAQASLVLVAYQMCISVNPALDMPLWNYMVRQRSPYHDIFNARGFEIIDASDGLGESLKKILDDPGKLFTDPDLEDFLPDIAPPPWVTASKKETSTETKVEEPQKAFRPDKILSLEDFLNKNLIGQTEAVDEITKTLKRSVAGLKDEKRPLGVFMLCGSSGSGKTHCAKMIQKHLFGEDSTLIRVDCGEFQQKHESMKLTGAPASFVGYEEGGQLTNAIKKSQNTVLLLDEAEKAHRDFWDVFLKVFDEGYLTDNHGENISFENTVIIMTSNLGNEKITQDTFKRTAGFTGNINGSYESRQAPPRSTIERETREAINKYFKPEFVNRLDGIIVFNYLNEEDMAKVAQLELNKLSKKITKLGLHFRWQKTAEKALALKSTKAVSGAREMARIRRQLVEDEIAHQILFDNVPKGTTFVLSAKKVRNEDDYEFVIKAESPAAPVYGKKAIGIE